MKILILLPIIIIGASLNSYAWNLKDASKPYQNPIANAGPNKTIFLTQTSSTTLDGSLSLGDSFQWTEISTDYMSGATITSPTSKVTTVTGLPQGVFYFRLSVTSGGITVKDSMKIIVDYDISPRNSYKTRELPLNNQSFSKIVNIRDDTISYFGYNEGYNGYEHSKYYEPDGVPCADAPGVKLLWLERCRTNGMLVDNFAGKLYTTIEDGYSWGTDKNSTGQTYTRSQITYDNNWAVDTNRTYVYTLKMYFPQSVRNNMASIGNPDWGRVAISGMHGNDDGSGCWGISFGRDSIVFNAQTLTGDISLGNSDDYFNKTHTIRVTAREGSQYPGQKAFIKVEVDGVQKYYNNDQKMGKTLMEDYQQITGLYDYRRLICDPDNKTRNKKFSLVTMSTDIYAINPWPTVDAGNDKTISSISTTLSGTANDEGVSGNGVITSYKWTKISGGTATIVSPNSATTNVTGLSSGIYQFELKATDDSGMAGFDTVQVIVSGNQLPKADVGSDRVINLPKNSIVLPGSGTDSDGIIVSYLWTQVSGPSQGRITNRDSANAGVWDLIAGTYQFKLTVIDNQGAAASKILNVVVNPALSIPLAVNAGVDKTITLPSNSILLSGSADDSVGTISSYSWTKIFGPSAYNISNPSAAVTTVSGLVQGTYQFELKVTDNNGAIGKDTVQVTVNAAPNLAPTANAGVDKTITLPTNSVSLSGAGTDSDGSISSYSWTKISGPSAYSIVSSSSAVTSVSGLVQGTYQFELKVTDNNGAVGKDTVQVTVNAAPNLAPTANAGADKTITLPTNSVSLSGSGTDPDGSISSYLWTKISGPSAYSISNSSAVVTNVSGLVQGIYQFELKVTDNNGAIGKDTVKITVNAAPNLAPTATAGTDKTITLPTNSVSLSGSGTDSDGSISSYSWTKISGPSAFNIVSSSSAVTSVSGLVQGTYQFELKVTDNNGAIGKDTVQVTVNAAPNLAPTANAGADKTITLPTNSVSLSGSGTDSDGSISSYSWTKISGPSAYSISNSSAAVTNVSGLVQGIYQFELKVTDNNAAIGKDTVQITVNAANNIAPKVNAGPDNVINLPANSVILSGSGTDIDGTIAAYSWTKISGPSAYSIVSSSSAVATVSGLVQGIYQFELKVTDNNGAIGKDTVQVTVNAAPNLAPTANAGADKTITLPTNSVSLSGSGTDTDGSISSYLWTKISGPSAFNIASSSAAVTNVSGLVQGIYQFELKITDNNGAIGKDTVQITVNAANNIAPKANAGPDNVINLPANSVILSGSGTDIDGTIAAYSWTKIFGPAAHNIANPSLAVTSVSNLVEGIYLFELKVTDDKGATGTDTMKVTVNKSNITVIAPTPNIAPVANAGNDTTALSPVNSIVLNGTANDMDGNITGYLWTQLSGPSQSSILPNNSASTTASNLIAGTYEFELKVTDNAGAEGRDTVKVTIALGRTAQESSTGLKVYPNPVHNIANVELSTQVDNSHVTIRITDISGVTVYQNEFVSTSNSIKKQIDMSRLGKGTYLVTAFVDGVVKESVKVLKL
jgi:hypothetical protein